MKQALILLLAIASVWSATAATIVENGEPRAEIIIAEKPARAADLGAIELQTYIRKISGATLPIVTKPTGNAVKIYVGQSAYTTGITAPTSDDGAYRIVSGDDYLALIGHDWDFTPIGPWARNRNEWINTLLPAWQEQNHAFWGDPIGAGNYNDYNGRAADFDPDGPRDTAGGKTGMWEFDMRGSQNAVYGFLRDLGVRWYMPGELGEVVPRQTTIELPKVDKTVTPDFRWRFANFARYGRDDQDTILWSMRLGSTNFYGELLSHGMRDITDSKLQKEAYPDYYALYAGSRNTVDRKANQCLSSPGLFAETVRYIRTMADVHHVKMVSVMPSDGYTSVCQCDLCKDKATLERGRDGWISDYVWDWVNRVATEIYKTNPDLLISNCAYGTYKLPPEKIDKLSPNVVVCIVGGRQAMGTDPKASAELEALRQAWLKKTDHKLITWINYPQMRRGEFRPVYWPRATAQSIFNTKGESQGDFSWLPENRGLDTPGVTHLSAYIYLDYLWNADQDINAVLTEYYKKFYGPAAAEMAAFIEYSEAHFDDLNKDKDAVETDLALFEKAKAKADPESVYGKRIALVDAYLAEMRKRRTQLSKERGPVPSIQMVDRDRGRWLEDRDSFKLDGKLDEAFWTKMPDACKGKLLDNTTGEPPEFPTTFKVVWANGNMYIGIRCQDTPGNPANIGTEKSGDPAIFTGDSIELLIETESHSYYQIVFNPAGATISLDRANPKNAWYEWDSKAEVAAEVGDDYWTVEAMIPVDQDSDDPNHLVAGRKPTESMPWHINVCRQRMRNNKPSYSCWSPNLSNGFHDVLKFGELRIR